MVECYLCSLLEITVVQHIWLADWNAVVFCWIFSFLRTCFQLLAMRIYNGFLFVLRIYLLYMCTGHECLEENSR